MKPNPFSITAVLVLLLCAAALLSCATYGVPRKLDISRDLLAEHRVDDAIAVLEAAAAEAREAKRTADLLEIKILLGAAYDEARRFPQAQHALHEAGDLAGAAGTKALLLSARLAVVGAKSWHYADGMHAAERTLAAIAPGTSPDPARALDDAALRCRLPADRERIQAQVLAEASLAVLFSLAQDHGRAIEWGERTVAHYGMMKLLIEQLPPAEQAELGRAQGAAAAVAARALRSFGRLRRAEDFDGIARTSFHRAGLPSGGGDPLVIAAEAAGYESLAGKGKDDFRPDWRRSPAFNDAELLLFQAEYSGALIAFEEAAAAARSAGRREEEALALWRIGRLLAETGRPAEARRRLSEAAAVGPDGDTAALAHAWLALLDGLSGRTEEALNSAELARSLLAEKRKGLLPGRSREAVLDAFLREPGDPPDMIALGALAAAQSARALLRIRQGGAAEARRSAEEEHATFALAEKSIALLPLRDRREFYEQSGYTSFAAAVLHLTKGDIPAGREELRRARDLFTRGGLPAGDVAAQGMQGYSLLLAKEYESFAPLARTVAARSRAQGFDELHWHVAARWQHAVLKELGDIAAEAAAAGRLPDTAPTDGQKREFADEAWMKLRRLARVLPEEEAERARDLLDGPAENESGMAAVARLAEIVRGLQREARNGLAAALAGMESPRALCEPSLSKRLALAGRDEFYRGDIVLAADIDGPAAAFDAAERAAGRTLIDGIRDHEISLGTPELEQEFAYLRRSVAAAAAKADRLADSGPAREELARAVAAAGEAMDRLRREEPRFAALAAGLRVGVDDLRKRLPPDVTLLRYHPLEKMVLVWIVDRAGVVLRRAGEVRKSDLRAMIARFQEAILRRDEAAANMLANELYDILVLSVKDDIKGTRIAVIPDGVTAGVPFAALRFGGRYLIQEYPLSYAAGATELAFSLDRERTAAGPASAVVQTAGPKGLPSLSAQRAAAATLRELHPKTALYEGSAAARAFGTDRVAESGIVHIAAYADVRDGDPFGTNLALGGLTVAPADLFPKRLRAGLVALDLCGMGREAWSGAPGQQAMNRALEHAGTAALVNSLWCVRDRSHPAFYDAFYRRLAASPRDEALRQAQLSLLATPEFGAPFFWAGYQLSGDWR